MKIARHFDSKQLVTGEYTANDNDNTVSLKVNLYDVDTGKLLLSHSYNGKTGINLFDTIDLIVKNISDLMKKEESYNGTNSPDLKFQHLLILLLRKKYQARFCQTQDYLMKKALPGLI